MAVNTTFVSGAVLTAAQMNNLPWGVVAYATKATTQGIGTTETDLSMNLSWTAVAGRIYRVSFLAVTNIGGTGANNNFINLYNGGTLLRNSIETVPANSWRTLTRVYYLTGLAAGAITLSWKSGNDAGSGTLNFYGTSTASSIAAQTMVEDMGAA